MAMQAEAYRGGGAERVVVAMGAAAMVVVATEGVATVAAAREASMAVAATVAVVRVEVAKG